MHKADKTQKNKEEQNIRTSLNVFEEMFSVLTINRYTVNFKNFYG